MNPHRARKLPVAGNTTHPYHAGMAVTRPLSVVPPENILSVTQLNRLARMLLEENFPAVLVEGEISNLSMPSSGHWYLTLKDDNAQVRCAMFRNRNMYVRFKPRNGVQVMVKARLSLYEGRGDYQLIVEQLEETGAGALRRAFEMLKAKLLQEGLFEAVHKKPLPTLPRHVAVITSPTGAAVRDVISVFRRRFPAIQITVVPVTVQGTQAAAGIVEALQIINQRQGCLHDVEAILLARGGGSLEDLWCFNEEALIRAIFASSLPVVSAIGHETDFTIADFVADIRAATPSAAAELLCPHQDDYRQQLAGIEIKLMALMRNKLQTHQQDLQRLRRQLRHPGRRLQEQAQRLDELELRCRRAMQVFLRQARHSTAMLQAGLLQNSPAARLKQHAQRLDALNLRCRRAMQLALQQARHRATMAQTSLLQNSPRAALQQNGKQVRNCQQRLVSGMHRSLQQLKLKLREQSHALDTVSPLATLSRGYAIATTEEGQIITRHEQARPGATIHTRLANGLVVSRVEHSRADDS